MHARGAPPRVGLHRARAEKFPIKIPDKRAWPNATHRLGPRASAKERDEQVGWWSGLGGGVHDGHGAYLLRRAEVFPTYLAPTPDLALASQGQRGFLRDETQRSSSAKRQGIQTTSMDARETISSESRYGRSRTSSGSSATTYGLGRPR